MLLAVMLTALLAFAAGALAGRTIEARRRPAQPQTAPTGGRVIGTCDEDLGITAAVLLDQVEDTFSHVATWDCSYRETFERSYGELWATYNLVSTAMHVSETPHAEAFHAVSVRLAELRRAIDTMASRCK